MVVWVLTHESSDNGIAVRGVFSSQNKAKDFIYSQYESTSPGVRRASCKGVFVTTPCVIDEGI
jgi:hypothetical protein